MLWYGLRSIPAEILDAAVLDGAGPLTCLLRVALPQRVAVIAAGWLVAMAVALGDLAASVLIVPPGVTTLAIRVFNLVHYGVEDRLAGICLFTLVAMALVAGAAFLLLPRGPSRGP
jgi:iron(III) transport system permease protein